MGSPERIIEKLRLLIENGDLEEASELIEINLTQFESSIEFQKLAGDFFTKTQQFGKAVNHYRKYLKLSGSDKAIETKIKLLSDILSKSSVDIYSSTNTHLDPWFE